MTIRFTDEKHARRCITIPAGTDLDGFIDSKGFTGFEYLVSKGFETPYQWGCKPYNSLLGQTRATPKGRQPYWTTIREYS